MRFCVGHVTHTFGKQPLGQTLADLAGIGYQGVELFTHQAEPFYPHPDGFASLLDKYGLRLSSLYYEGSFYRPETRETECEAVKAAASFLRSLGGRHLIVGPSPRPQGGLTCADLREMAEALNTIGRLTLEYGVHTCFHPHVGGTVETPAEIRMVFNATDPDVVFFAPDTGHLQKGGWEAIDCMQTYLDRIRFVHLKDMDLHNSFVELGQGVMNISAVLRLLVDGGYEGWLLPEVPARGRSPQESAQISFKYLNSLICDGNMGRPERESR